MHLFITEISLELFKNWGSSQKILAVKIEKSNVSINVLFVVRPSLYGESVAVGVVCFGDRVAAGSLRCTEHKIKLRSNHTLV